MEDEKYDELRKLISSAEKPLDLRDHLAIEVLNGILSNSKAGDTGDFVRDLLHYIHYDNESISDGERKKAQEGAAKRIEKLIRSCYKVADIMRKVRLSTFE